MAEEEKDYCLQQISKIKKSRDTYKKYCEEVDKFYSADPSIIAADNGRSKLTTTDLMDEIQRDKPALLNDLVGPDMLWSLDPKSEKETESVKNMEKLINHQAKRQNQWFRICDTMTDTLLKYRIGGIKYQWVKEMRPVDIIKFKGTAEEYEAFKAQTPNLKISENKVEKIKAPVTDPATGEETEVEIEMHECTGMVEKEFQGIKLEAVHPLDCLFFLHETDIDGRTFLAFILRYDEWDIKREFGEDVFKKVEKQKAKVMGKDDIDPLLKKKFEDLGGNIADYVYDEKEKKWIFYDCYYQNQKNGLPWRKIVSGEVVALEELNIYFEPPAIIGTPILNGHTIIGLGAHDLTKEQQRLKTFLFRQTGDNLMQANHRRYFADVERLNQSDYLDNNTTNALIRTEGDPRTVVFPEEKAPLPPELFQFIEMVNQQSDSHGITGRAFSGVSKQNVNRSFRGQAQQLQAASQKLQMISKVIAETILIPLGRKMANLNTRFLTQEMSFRYFDKPVVINKENISDNADFSINIGLGVTSKDNQIVQLQQVMGLMMQDLKTPNPITTPQNRYHVAKELLSVMGYKDTSNFLTDPKQSEAIKQLLMMLFQMMPMIQQMGVQLPPPVMQTIMKVAQLFGVKPPPPPPPPGMPGQSGPPGATFPGQNTPAQAVQPAQPVTARVTPDGGGHYS